MKKKREERQAPVCMYVVGKLVSPFSPVRVCVCVLSPRTSDGHRGVFLEGARPSNFNKFSSSCMCLSRASVCGCDGPAGILSPSLAAAITDSLILWRRSPPSHPRLSYIVFRTGHRSFFSRRFQSTQVHPASPLPCPYVFDRFSLVFLFSLFYFLRSSSRRKLFST